MKMDNLIMGFAAASVALSLSVAVAGPLAAQETRTEPAKVDPLQIARGAKAWSEQCGRCHNIRSPSELGDEEWHVSATHMRVRANIPGDTIRDIRAFLKSSN
ncbi:MAG: hypothetical protein Tsb008_15080 [Rhodothalassiaceae bacterium]